MTLTEIEYGSIASSEVINNNFNHLENKIAQVNEAVMTNISSLASNIATINSRLTELSEELNDIEADLNIKIETYRAKTKLLVAGNSMLPNWGTFIQIEITNGESYTAETNGYLLLIPNEGAEAVFTLNAKEISGVSGFVIIPVCEGDIFSASTGLKDLYVLPQKEFSIEGF